MKDDRTERDAELAAALSSVSGEAPVDEVDWGALRRSIHGRTAAASEWRTKARRRARAFIGTAMAASVALLFLLSRSGDVGQPAGSSFAAGTPTLEEILGADVSEEELRTMLAGAGGVEALLMLAASESEL